MFSEKVFLLPGCGRQFLLAPDDVPFPIAGFDEHDPQHLQ